MITIETTRYSAVVRAFAESFPNAVIKLNRKVVEENLDDWCTNSRLQAAQDFSLMEGKEEILGFHDNPRDMWAVDKALPLVKDLSNKKVLRFTVSEPSPRGLLAKIFRRHA